MTACTLCHGVGWVLDGNPTQDPQMLELIACPIPDCDASGRPVQSISFSGLKFRAVHNHPSESYVMSVSGGA
jgi:hypothetical protein